MDALEQFVNDLLDNKLEAYMKSEPVPDNSDKDVKVWLIMPPTLKKWGGILVSACPYVRTYSCSRYRLETSCMDSSWKNSRRIFLVFPELSPLVKLRPFDKQGDEIL